MQSSPAIGDDGTIYVGSYDANLYALNPDGTLKCTYSAFGAIGSSPAIGQDSIIYVGSGNENRLHAVYSDCTLEWKTEMHSNGIGSSPALSPDGTMVYYGSEDGYVYARYTSDGSLKWKSPWTYGGIQSSPAIGSDGTVYVGTQYGNLWAINPEDGTLKWDYYVTLGAWSAPAIGADGTIYFGTDYGHIFAMNPDGTAKWTYNGNTLDAFRSSPAIGSDGSLYIGSTDGKLYSFGAPTIKTVDMVETAVSNPPSNVAPRSTFQVTDTVTNQGNDSAGASTTRYYLSTDDTKDSTDKRLTGTRAVPVLAPGANSSGTVTVTIPSIALGTYYLLACADDQKNVVESNEKNNCIASATTVQVTP